MIWPTTIPLHLAILPIRLLPNPDSRKRKEDCCHRNQSIFCVDAVHRGGKSSKKHWFSDMKPMVLVYKKNPANCCPVIVQTGKGTTETAQKDLEHSSRRWTSIKAPLTVLDCSGLRVDVSQCLPPTNISHLGSLALQPWLQNIPNAHKFPLANAMSSSETRSQDQEQTQSLWQ